VHRSAHAFLRTCIGTLALGFTLGACDKGEAKPDAASKPAAAEVKAGEVKAGEAKVGEAKVKTPDPAPTADTKVPAVDAKAPAQPEVDAAAPPEPAPPPTEATPAAVGTPTGPVIVTMDGELQLDLDYETIGGVHVHMAAADVETKLGKPATKSKISMEGATGDFIQTWDYSAVGLEVGMKADSRKGAQKVAYLKANATCKLPMSWGLHIGSTRAELEKVYGSNFDEAFTNEETFTAGSIYWGVSYELVDGKVASIFMGAGAE